MAKKEFELLEELIRTAYKNLDPVDKYSYLYHKNTVKQLQGEKPNCFLALRRRSDGGRMGQPLNTYMLPVCNRAGFEDPDIINLSIKMIKRLMNDDRGQFDINDLKSALTKLQHKHDVYSKDVPKPATMAGYKANTTRMFNRIKDYLKRD